MSKDNKKVVFLDRDGMINKEVGYLHKSKDFKFIDGVFKACQYFQKLGYQLIVVTNQALPEAIIKKRISMC
jgi:D-glycero-D-manno-heptose 1,7-bisphosphate phosphatase